MLDRLLFTSTRILRLIYGKKLGVNEIIKQTSPDRSYVVQTLKSMEKARLLSQGPRNIGKKRPVKLTPLGNELASFYNDLDNFKKTYFEINTFRNDLYIESDHIPTINKILKDRNWDADDIADDRYDNLKWLLRNYSGVFYGDMLQIVHHRSLKILHRNKVNLKTERNEIIKIILEGIILDVIDFTFGSLFSKVADGEFNFEERIVSKERRLTEYLNERSEMTIPFFAMKKVKKYSSSFMELIDPGKDTVLNEIRELEGMIEDAKTWRKSESAVKHIALHPLLEATKEYLKKS